QELDKVSNIKAGYFPQNYDEVLDLESNVVTYLSNSIGSDKESITKIMTYLSAVNFLEDELNYKIKELSSGQRAKVLLLKIILEKSNVLVLDEPTRNLSPLSSPKICEILSDFKGVIISVSHDRSYINQVCDKAYSLNEEGLELVSSNNEFD
ncbi:MAG: ATP-binding cassette domain-containing protein, partial [Erysipelotrichales bacterium]|nr:ATP-binding cassette domain-containing protein [Erysipelotrichales bacterium]